MRFSDLELAPPLLRAVQEAGYEQPSPIQQKAIPPVLAGRDLLGCAQTGTGKTAAFALPILQRLAANHAGGRRPIRALVLTPTRELALQIQESFVTYGKHLPLRSAVIFGGVGQAPQVQQLQRGVDVLVATPGRLNDLIGQGYVKLDKLEIFVLDEADRMLDMGFVQDVKRVIRQLPEKRQNLLYSATMPPEIVALADGILHDPAKVFVTPPATTVEKIEQHLYKVDKPNKRHLLAQLLRGPGVRSALVFTRTKHGADQVVRELKRAGIAALAIHGNKSQGARQNALGRFKDGEIAALVATDIAARGLDINELSHVFNYNLPNIPETYVHRIGRTGRAGHSGIAISFCAADELPFLADIERLIGFSIPEVTGHPWPMTSPEPPPKESRAAAPKAQKAPGGKKSAPAAPPPSVADKQPRKSARAPERKRDNAQAPNPYDNRTGGNAIVTKRPVWAGASGAQPEGDDSMSRNNRRRRGGRRGGEDAGQPPVQPPAREPQQPAKAQAQPPQRARRRNGGPATAEKQKPLIPKNENGVFDFSEEELAEDNSLKLLSGSGGGEAKYASFEDYLKDH